MIFTEEFNRLTDNKYSYLMPSHVDLNIPDSSVVVEFIIPHDKMDRDLTDAVRSDIECAVREIIPIAFKLTVKFKKFYVDSESAVSRTRDFFDKNYPSIPADGIEIEAAVDGDAVIINVKVDKLFFSSLDEERVSASMTDFLHTKFSNPIEITFERIERDNDLSAFIVRAKEEFYIRRRVKTTNHFKMTGRSIGIDPSYIMDRPETEKSGVYCGRIESYEKKISKKTGKPFYIFTIYDTTGRLICKAFPRSEQNEYDHIAEGDTVIVQGKIDRDTYAGDSVMLVSDLSKCVIDYSSIVNEREYNKAPDYYEYVSPKPFVNLNQRNMFEDSRVPAACVGKSFVVFDLETTGLDKNSCKIIEIGAVKIADGIIKESFSTFVDPEEHISAEITDITSITDDDVKGAPTIRQVFPDFYKFIEGIPLVAHNAPFDVGFISVAASELNYKLNNRAYDTIDIAKKIVSSPNYKLGTLCKLFDIDNEHAHRAIHDAAATAELFVKELRLAEKKGITAI